MSSLFHVNVDRQLDIVNRCKLQELVGSTVIVISAGSRCTFAIAGSLRFRAVVYYLFLNDPEGFSSCFFFSIIPSHHPPPPPHPPPPYSPSTNSNSVRTEDTLILSTEL